MPAPVAEAASHGTQVTPIEQLLAEEEQGAAQTAAKKAKKQRQKAKKQQQRQAQQHLLEQQQQQQGHQKEQQQQQQHVLQQDHQQAQQQPATKLTTTQDQQAHQQNEQAQLPGRIVPDDGSDVVAALAQLAVSTRHLAAGSTSSAAKPKGAATGRPQATGQSEDTESAVSLTSGGGSASAQQPSLQGSDAFLQDLFCCPLTKVCLHCCNMSCQQRSTIRAALMLISFSLGASSSNLVHVRRG